MSDWGDNLKAQSWCIKNGYKVYPEPYNKSNYRIIISKGDKMVTVGGVYTYDKMSKKIWELYKKLYENDKAKRESN